jgi:hypothetical protein
MSLRRMSARGISVYLGHVDQTTIDVIRLTMTTDEPERLALEALLAR